MPKPQITTLPDADESTAGAPTPTPVMLSVVIPMFNEEENLAGTVDRVAATLKEGFLDGAWEIIIVNDGSTDETAEVALRLAKDPAYPWLRVKGYATNRGRGMALRTGFAAARGQWIVSIDADLSYEPRYILDLVAVLRQQDDIDIVLASAYMPGGGAENVPMNRLFVSKFGNRILGWFMSAGGHRIHTITCVFRAYRREVLDSMELESDGKDIHLEILSKALMLGYRVTEVPAILRRRAKGRSKFKFRTTAASHLIFALFERPILIFGMMGLAGMFGGLSILAYATVKWLRGVPFNWNRPIMTIMILLLLGGLQMLAFGIIGTQFVNLRKESIKIQARLRQLMSRNDSNETRHR
ncbi:glycosyltransferase [bacterium]|nr:glycosyltransferase [bacterium]